MILNFELLASYSLRIATESDDKSTFGYTSIKLFLNFLNPTVTRS